MSHLTAAKDLYPTVSSHGQTLQLKSSHLFWGRCPGWERHQQAGGHLKKKVSHHNNVHYRQQLLNLFQGDYIQEKAIITQHQWNVRLVELQFLNATLILPLRRKWKFSANLCQLTIFNLCNVPDDNLSHMDLNDLPSPNHRKLLLLFNAAL